MSFMRLAALEWKNGDLSMINLMFWIFGCVGAIAFAINLAPQIYKCYKEKSAKQISKGFLVLAYMGNIFSAAFVAYTNYCTGLWQYPIYFNYRNCYTFDTCIDNHED